MKEFITGDVVANWVRMTRQGQGGAVVVVEGGADAILFSQVLDNSSCNMINAFTKKNVIDSLIILDAEKIEGVLGIIDADFHRLLNIQLPSNNLLLTDTHDLETMLIVSPALELVLSQHGSYAKLNHLDKAIRQIIIDSALPYGFLRMISEKETLYLDFEGIKYHRYTDKKTLETDISKLIIAILSRSRKSKIDPERLLRRIRQLQKENNDHWQICCGPDMIQIISIGLRAKFGTNNAQQVHPEIIDKALRIGYTPAYFSSTKLYKLIKVWQKSNNKFQVCLG